MGIERARLITGGLGASLHGETGRPGQADSFGGKPIAGYEQADGGEEQPVVRHSRPGLPRLLAGQDCPPRPAHRTAVEGEHATTREPEASYLPAIQAQDADAHDPALDPAEYAKRLQQIDWHRYRQHWIAITGFKVDKNGKKKTRLIKDGRGGTLTIVDGKAENTAATINSTVNKILSPAWTDLTSSENAK